jgi:hydroxymethylpyrimidine pyrophosphatase-like HAD family hydrolase
MGRDSDWCAQTAIKLVEDRWAELRVQMRLVPFRPLTRRLGDSSFMSMDLPIKLVSTDFDGTLFCDHETPAVPTHLQELLADFQDRGGVWVINTGRDLPSLLEDLRDHQIEPQPDFLVVVERLIYQREGDHFKPLVSWNAECTRKHEELAFAIQKELPSLVQWINRNSRASVFTDEYSPLAVVATSNREMDSIESRVLELADRLPDTAWMRNDVYARICHVDYSKGTTLSEIQRLLGIDPSEVFAIGDHLNDLAMFDPAVAAHVAVPENAVSAVKARILEIDGTISEYSHGHAVAFELKRLIDTV